MPVTMEHRLRTPAVLVLVAVVLAIVGLQLTGSPATAPTVTSSGDSGPAGGEEVPAEAVFPEPEPWTAVAWEAPIPDAFGPADVLRRVEGLVAGEELYLAWGRTPMPGRNQFNDMGAIFASRDGAHWRAIPVEHGVEPANASSISGIAAGPAGYLGVGNVCCEPERGALWHSADGLAWQRIEPRGDFDPARTSPIRVVAAPAGWVMLLSSRGGTDTEVLFSEDGQEWTSVMTLEGGRHRPAASGLARTAAHVVVVGTVEGAGGSYDGGVWRSADGRRWERVAARDPALTGDGEVQLQGVAAHAGGLLVTGMEGTAEQRAQCEQLLGKVASVGQPPEPPRWEATSCASGDMRAWTSVDGSAWEAVVPPPGVVPIEFHAMAPAGPGLVVLGETSAPASPDTALFASPDGESWQLLDDGQPMHRDMAIALAARGRDLIAVTERFDGATTSLQVWRGRAD